MSHLSQVWTLWSRAKLWAVHEGTFGVSGGRGVSIIVRGCGD